MFLSHSIFLSVCLYFSVWLYLCLPLSLSIILSLFLSMCNSLSLWLFLSLSVSLALFLCLFLGLRVFFVVSLSVSVSFLYWYKIILVPYWRSDHHKRRTCLCKWTQNTVLCDQFPEEHWGMVMLTMCIKYILMVVTND